MSLEQGCRVQVIGTSRADLNGQVGTVQHSSHNANPDKERWQVLVDSTGATVALKPANLKIVAGSGTGAGGGGGMPGMGGMGGMPGMSGPQMAQAQAQAMKMYGDFQAAAAQLLPPGVSLKVGLGIAAFLAVFTVFTLGFMRGVIVLSVLGGGVATFVPAYRRAGVGAGRTAVEGGCSRFLGAATGGRVQVTGWKALLAVVAFAALVFVLLSPGGLRGAMAGTGAAGGGDAAGDAVEGDLPFYNDGDGDDDDDDDDLGLGDDAAAAADGKKAAAAYTATVSAAMDAAYKAGFDAATKGDEFGAGKPPAPAAPAGTGHAGSAKKGGRTKRRGRKGRRKPTPVNLDGGFAAPPPAAGARGGFGGMGGGGMGGIGGMMSMAIIGQTVYALGQGGGGAWSPSAAMRNVRDPNGPVRREEQRREEQRRAEKRRAEQRRAEQRREEKLVCVEAS